MIGVLIVDDEYLIRDIIKDSVNYEALGFEITGEAEDGMQALKKVEELAPQLIILDINIPFINGIELSKIVKEKYPDIKIVILTGYSEFEYAKECIKIGVSDYVLKPIDPDNFRRILLDIKNDITKETNQKQYLNKLEKEVRSSSDVIKEHFLNKLILERTLTEAFITEQMLKFDLNLHEKEIVVATIYIDNIQYKWDGDEDRKLYRYAVLNLSGEIFSELKSSTVFCGPDNHIICIASTICDKAGNHDKDIISVCRRVANSVSEFWGFTVTIGIGGVCDGYGNIHISYRESILAIQEKFFKGYGRIIKYREISFANRLQQPFKVKSNEREVLILLRTGNREAYLELINGLKKEMIKVRPSIETIRMVYSNLAMVVQKYAWENNLKTEEVISEQEKYIDCINGIETIEDLNNWVIGLFDKVIKDVNDKNKTRTVHIVEKARKYIEENYLKPDISLEEISERIFINPSYLSKVFKREMKYSVIEYLTDLRMKKAKEIMDESPDLRIGFVANKVGYSDPFYFSKLFRKYYGVAPSKYIEKK